MSESFQSPPLSRREQIATQLLAALLSGVAGTPVPIYAIEEFQKGVAQAPRLAVQLADALIKELDK
jgi:hypothetical protein